VIGCALFQLTTFVLGYISPNPPVPFGDTTNPSPNQRISRLDGFGKVRMTDSCALTRPLCIDVERNLLPWLTLNLDEAAFMDVSLFGHFRTQNLDSQDRCWLLGLSMLLRYAKGEDKKMSTPQADRRTQRRAKTPLMAVDVPPMLPNFSLLSPARTNTRQSSPSLTPTSLTSARLIQLRRITLE
jgi:hypothetical protein